MRVRVRLVWVLVAAVGCLYAVFMVMDFHAPGLPASTWLKYAGLSLCAAMPFLYKGKALSPPNLLLLRLGMLLTLIADAFLLLLGRALPGVLMFIAVQAVHTVRHSADSWKKALPWAAAAAAFGGVAGRILGEPAGMKGLLPCAAGAYAALILSSLLAAVVSAVRRAFPRPNRMLIVSGMVLFLLCDVCVALFNVLEAGAAQTVSLRLIWLFYMPSQALLALSAMKFTVAGEAPAGL